MEDESELHPDDESPCDDARVTVRGTKDDEGIEESLRGWEMEVRADAKANDGVVPPQSSGRSRNPAVRLTEAKPPVPVPCDTETELNGLIAECRYLMREVAFNSARLTYDPDDRVRFLASAESLAKTAAMIGGTVAQLRSAGMAPAPVEERRQRITVEHVQIGPARKEGGTPDSPGSAKQ